MRASRVKTMSNSKGDLHIFASRGELIYTSGPSYFWLSTTVFWQIIVGSIFFSINCKMLIVHHQFFIRWGLKFYQRAYFCSYWRCSNWSPNERMHNISHFDDEILDWFRSQYFFFFFFWETRSWTFIKSD